MSAYNIWIIDDTGRKKRVVTNWSSLEYVLVLGSTDYLTLEVPASSPGWDSSIRDEVIEVWRTPKGGSQSLEFTGFIMNYSYTAGSSGRRILRIEAFGLNHLLERRIHAYTAEPGTGVLTGKVDDVMKSIVELNLGASSATDWQGNSTTGRDISDRLSIDSDSSEGPDISTDQSWANVLDALQELQKISVALGTEVFFGIVRTGLNDFTFRTKAGLWGVDFTKVGGGQPQMLLSSKLGNLKNVRFTVDYYGEKNYVYVVGSGQTPNRVVGEAAASTYQDSFFARTEASATASGQIQTQAILDDLADTLSTERSAVKSISADLVSSSNAVYDGAGFKGWNLGSKLTVREFGEEFDVVVRAVSVRVSADGSEEIVARIEQQR